jgi:SAM-dependent methyltransferase
MSTREVAPDRSPLRAGVAVAAHEKRRATDDHDLAEQHRKPVIYQPPFWWWSELTARSRRLATRAGTAESERLSVQRGGPGDRGDRPREIRARVSDTGADVRSGNLACVSVDYDAELRVHNARLRRVYGIGLADRVIDVGCGTGQTTRDAAHTAVGGSVLGVDTSVAAIERARELAYREGLHNVTHAVADAQVHSFEDEHRRDGPVLAGRPGRRHLDPRCRRVRRVVVHHVDEPVYYGPDVAAALAWVRGFADVGTTLQQLDPASREHALARLVRTLGAHARTDGIWFDSRAWIVTAHRA